MHSRYTAALAALTIAAAAPIAHADVASPDSKFIMHTIRLEGANTYAGKYRFYSVTMPHTKVVATADQPNPWVSVTYNLLKGDGEINAKNVSPRYALRLAAVPIDKTRSSQANLAQMLYEACFTDQPNGFLLSDPIPRQRTVSRTDPHSALLTRYKIVIKDIAAEKDKPATKKLSLALVGNEWSAVTPAERKARLAYLLGVPFFALLGLVGRLRTRLDAE